MPRDEASRHGIEVVDLEGWVGYPFRGRPLEVGLDTLKAGGNLEGP